MINKVEICGVNTSKLTVLKESEKIELIKKSRTGIRDRDNSRNNEDQALQQDT